MKRSLRTTQTNKWQRDLSVFSHDKIGEILGVQGDDPGALRAYRKSLEIAETLAARDPANTEWQRDLSISHEKIGHILAAHGDSPAALEAYRKSLEIAEMLAARDPANTEWQRDLSVIHVKFGNTLTTQGDRDGALAAYQKALKIAETLAARDPANTQWQSDLSWSITARQTALDAQVDVLGRWRRIGRTCKSPKLVAHESRRTRGGSATCRSVTTRLVTS